MLKFLISFIFIGHIFAKDQLNIQIDQQADGIKVITIDFDPPKPKNLRHVEPNFEVIIIKVRAKRGPSLFHCSVG